MYLSKEEYRQMYPGGEESEFEAAAYEAERIMDIQTTGIDRVRKLQRFFPEDEYDVKAVKHCAGKLIHTILQIRKAEAAAEAARGYETTENGIRGKVISSVSAGNESISYSTPGSSGATTIDAAAKDRTERERLLCNIALDYLRGVDDANGISLLYMGEYPRRYLC